MKRKRLGWGGLPGGAAGRGPGRGPRAILVPMDYEGPSRAAFEVACRLAAGGAGRLTLVHVPEAPRVHSFGMAEGPPLPAGYRGAWESRLSLIRPRDPEVRVKYRIEEGDTAGAILRAAEQAACDLIVMGRRRKAGLARLMGRGVSGRVSGRARCPVLTVTPPGETGGLERANDFSRGGEMLEHRTILHPTDFSAPAMYALGLARDLARSTGGDLLVIHVAPARLCRKRGYRRETDEALRRLADSDPKGRAQSMLLAGDPALQILSTASQLDCGLIVMGTNGRTGLSRLLHGSVARAVQGRARCPVLTVRLPVGEEHDGADFAAARRASDGRAGRAARRDTCLACGGRG